MITSPSNELVIPTVTFYCRPITSDGRGSRPLIMKFTTVSNLSRFSGGREDIFIVRRGNSCPSRSLIRASTFTAAKSVSTLNALQCLVSWSYVYDLALQDKQLSGQIEEGREEQCFGAFLFFRLRCWGSKARRAKKGLLSNFHSFPHPRQKWDCLSPSHAAVQRMGTEREYTVLGKNARYSIHPWLEEEPDRQTCLEL